MLLITWQKPSPIFAFLSGKIGFWLPNALQTCTNHVCLPVWVNSCKHSWEKCKWTTKFWFKWRTLKKQGYGKTGCQLCLGSLLSVNISHTVFFFWVFFLRTLHECEWKTKVWTYPNSGSAVKCKGLDLSILQEHLQHIWYKKQRVVLEHCLKEIEGEKLECSH